MASGSGSVLECAPRDAWDQLKVDSNAALVDVRTRAEWAFVGVPDLSELGRQTVLLEWQRFPDMSVNAGFADELKQALGDVPDKIFFICRSGARSLNAANAVAASLGVTCVNVAEGFEGDLDRNGHRGSVNGWKVQGLPWRQN